MSGKYIPPTYFRLTTFYLAVVYTVGIDLKTVPSSFDPSER